MRQKKVLGWLHPTSFKMDLVYYWLWTPQLILTCASWVFIIKHFKKNQPILIFTGNCIQWFYLYFWDIQCERLIFKKYQIDWLKIARTSMSDDFEKDVLEKKNALDVFGIVSWLYLCNYKIGLSLSISNDMIFANMRIATERTSLKLAVKHTK